MKQDLTHEQQLGREVAEVEDWFRYHAPDSYQQALYEQLNDKFKEIALFLVTHLEPSRERSIALTDLRKMRMTANMAVAHSTPS